MELPPPNSLSRFFAHVKVERNVKPAESRFCALATSESYWAEDGFVTSPMVLYCGYGSSSCAWETFAEPMTPAPPCPKNGLFTEALSAEPIERYWLGNWLMFRLPVPVGEGCRCAERDPIYPTSAAMPNGSCCCTSADNCWMIPDVRPLSR